MDSKSRLSESYEIIKTICVGGIYILDKRIGYDRRDKTYKCQLRYDRRLSNWPKSFNRRRQLIDIVI